ncbi:MAG: hypothetical protein LUF30_05605 [Lachnospiraceae bacterium]|nr:hypothetical protein [Lachnospiraceae bacterium]
MVGEAAVVELFSDFSCEYKEGLHNDEVEHFLKGNSIAFARKKMSITSKTLAAGFSFKMKNPTARF